MLHQHCRGLLKSKGLLAKEVVSTMISNRKALDFAMRALRMIDRINVISSIFLVISNI